MHTQKPHTPASPSNLSHTRATTRPKNATKTPQSTTRSSTSRPTTPDSTTRPVTTENTTRPPNRQSSQDRSDSSDNKKRNSLLSRLISVPNKKKSSGDVTSKGMAFLIF